MEVVEFSVCEFIGIDMIVMTGENRNVQCFYNRKR